MSCVGRSGMLINNKLKKLIKKKRNARFRTLIRDATPSALRDCRGSTLLHLAVHYKNSKLVDYSLDEGCDINAQDAFQNTPLMIAATQKNFKLTGRLLDANADVFLTNDKDECPLYVIFQDVENVPQDVIERLVKVIGNSNRIVEVADILVKAKCKLNVVIEMRNAELTLAVLERRETIEEAESFNSVRRAMEMIDVQNTYVLLHHGDGKGPRVYAFHENLVDFALNENVQGVQAYLEHILDWTIWSETMIESYTTEIFGKADMPILNLFLQREFPENMCGIDLMSHCAGNRNPDVIDMMKERLEDLEKWPLLGKDRRYPLHFAVEHCIVENVEIMLMAGMDPTIKDINGLTPLYYACSFDGKEDVDEEKNKQCVFALLYFDIDCQVINVVGKSIFNSYDPEKDWYVIKIVLQHLALLEGIEKITEVIRDTIDNNEQLKTYYEKCRKEVESMRKTYFLGKVTVYSILIQNEVVTARSIRNNDLIELNKNKTMTQWSYYYRERLTWYIHYIKMVNDIKNEISCILHECLGVLRLNYVIIDQIVDSFPCGDVWNFIKLFK